MLLVKMSDDFNDGEKDIRNFLPIEKILLTKLLIKNRATILFSNVEYREALSRSGRRSVTFLIDHRIE